MTTNFWLHLKTIRIHRKFVRQACFKLGIPLQGLLHDLSKYSPAELSIAKWYTGTKSPHDTARAELGYSPSWYHHRNKNKHHTEYWIDSFEKKNAVQMPYRFVLELFADFIAASKTYEKENYTLQSPWNYWMTTHGTEKGRRIIHPETEYLFEKLLWVLHESDSEKDFFIWYRNTKDYLNENYNLKNLKSLENEIYNYKGACL